VSAPKKYDEEFRDRAVRMYRDRLAEPGESKLGARRHVGSLLDVNQATLRNWVEERYAGDGAKAGSGRSNESEEIRALKKRVPSWSGPTRSSRPAPRFSLRRSSTADSSDRGLHRRVSGPVRRRADLHRAVRARCQDRAVDLLRPGQAPGHRR
jgi:transposase